MSKVQKLELEKCDENSPYWIIIESLFDSEWPGFKFVDTYTNEAKLPPVIVALVDGKVIGGLAYSRYQEPNKGGEVIWFNAVYVCHEWRGNGIASKLIHVGVKQVSVEVQSRLYTYTNTPELYTSLGWSVVDIESEPNHKVMSLVLKA